MSATVLDVAPPVVGPRYVDATIDELAPLLVTLVNHSRDRSAAIDLERSTPHVKTLRIVLNPGEEATLTLQPGMVRIKLGHDARLELR